MKRSIAPFIAVGLAAAVACPNVFAGSGPGEVDFGQFAELARNAKYVDIQVSHTLISLASHFVQKEQPEVASLLRSVELIRLNVIGLNDENRDEMVKRVREIRARLDQQGWQRVIVVQQKSGETVGIYVKTGAGDAVQPVDSDGPFSGGEHSDTRVDQGAPGREDARPGAPRICA